jgi:hypothetical protein
MTIDAKYILGLAAALIMGWFAFGVIFNLRRGESILRWIRGGLPKIGERTTFRWLGSSVAEMVITQARRPFRRLETLLVLVPRDVPWLWLLSGTQGRRDTLIFRGQLTTAPLLDLELSDPKSWTGHRALKEAEARGWDSQPYQGLQLMAPKGLSNLALRIAEQVYPKAQVLDLKIYRLALRKDQPHFELHLPFPDPNSQANDYFEALQDVAQTASEKFLE